MSTTSGVRFVKCPKCYKVLPENPNVPVYLCGGCGTILRAKIRTTSGETSKTEPNQGISTELSEKDSYNAPLTVSANQSSILNNSERSTEHKIADSAEVQTKNTEKLDPSVSADKTKILSYMNLSLNPNSNVTENRSKEENAEADMNHEEPVKENHAPLTVHHVVLNSIDRLTKHEVPKKKKITSTSSEDFHSAHDFMGLRSEKLVRQVPKDAAVYRKTPRTSHSYEVLQADILNKVDKLRNELVELFGKVPDEMALSQLVHAERESNRYRRIRITAQDNTTKAHQHHYVVKGTSSPSHRLQNTQGHKHGKRHQFIPKNHCRPILVGAPFVICSNCFQLIQLPADFNVSSKRLRKLQCGKCSAILLYSYRQQPYQSKDTTPLTSSDTESGTTPYTDPFPRGDPISISEEYGISFGMSYSTDPDPGPPLHVSRNSSYSTADGRSGRQTIGSRLHQIMGYESASEILFRQSSERSVRHDEISERVRKGKIIVDENPGIGPSHSKLKRYSPDSTKPSGIHGLFKKGIIKLKP